MPLTSTVSKSINEYTDHAPQIPGLVNIQGIGNSFKEFGDPSS